MIEGKILGKAPIIKNLILKVLREKKQQGFTELLKEAELAFGKKANHGSLSHALISLQEEGLIAQTSEGKYELTDIFHQQQVKNLLQNIITKSDAELINGEGLWAFDYDLPHVVITNPPQEESEGSHYIEKWGSPSDGISTIILNDFLSLNAQKKTALGQLIAWAYWGGIQSSMKNYGIEPLPELLNDKLEFVEKSMIRKDSKEAPHIKRILNITQELIAQSSLFDFLEYYHSKEHEVLDHLRYVEPGIGERIFGDLTDIGKTTLEGLNLLGDWYLMIEQSNLGNDPNTWGQIFSGMLRELEPETLKHIKGAMPEAKKRKLAKHLGTLIDLAAMRKIAVVYLWNHESGRVADIYEKVPMITAWLDCLKEGNLDHRSWIFEEDTLRVLGKAWRMVKRNQPPDRVRIDVEHWSLRDIYDYYPKGKDPLFWEELIKEVEKRAELIAKSRTPTS